MVRSEEIPRVARYLTQKELEYQVVIDNLQKEIEEENDELSEQEMLELEGRKGLQFLYNFHATSPQAISIRLFYASLAYYFSSILQQMSLYLEKFLSKKKIKALIALTIIQVTIKLFFFVNFDVFLKRLIHFLQNRPFFGRVNASDSETMFHLSLRSFY